MAFFAPESPKIPQKTFASMGFSRTFATPISSLEKSLHRDDEEFGRPSRQIERSLEPINQRKWQKKSPAL
jgi:hypothetical protein